MEGTASGVGLPPLYDVRVRRVGASAVDPIRTGARGRRTRRAFSPRTEAQVDWGAKPGVVAARPL